MRLIELAEQLSCIFKDVAYVTVGNPTDSLIRNKVVSVFLKNDNRGKPEYVREYIYPGIWGVKHPSWTFNEGKPFYSPGMFRFPVSLIQNLDLSEYKDETGEIDYSRCIVEV